jgi:trehalose 6-phosphate phosphatase
MSPPRERREAFDRAGESFVKDILSLGGRALLEELARSNVLVGFDYDGTLAPIAASPEQALMRPSTASLLTQVARRYPCAVVSGRGLRDVQQFVGAAPLSRIVGNHGLEWPTPPPRIPRATVERWYDDMLRECGAIRGVMVEDKTWSIAVHWRRARLDKASARRRVLAAAAKLRDARLLHGKDVINVVHPQAPDKGDAILAIRTQLRCDNVLYVGDDATDEDVFRLSKPEGLVAVRVGRAARTSAKYFVRGQSRMDDLLSALLALRPASRARA